MATFRSFEEIDAWKKARELTRRIYDVTSKGTFARDCALRDQIRRACVSVMANVAEGHGRGGTREFQQFLSMALGSAGEVGSHLYVALDQGYIDDRGFRELAGLAQENARLIGGLARYLRTTERKGSKFKPGNQEPGTRNQEPRTKN
ncbi:four helix bundle protein [candidate division WOR-3 bacterium]|uniref:Four helix bundle protein n=1 Tax=candidate division WOR-3 bacterium TaxID=2052148 RepID=A0A938BU22_UNCW3|nr:four helix bundle protein [candidate division WOR-3 bacterium]